MKKSEKQPTKPLDEYSQRKNKLESIREQGINPYPATFRDDRLFVEQVQTLGEGSLAALAGRIMSMRDMGKIIFCHIQDATGRFQLVLKEDTMSVEQLQQFREIFDVADFIGAQGEIFTTKKGELSLLVNSVTLLSKALRPLPEKWHGIKDEELRFRKRYLDLLTNPELRDVFVRKNIFWQSVRTFLGERNFLEVETPVLETSAGGADAEPFVTHHNALDIDVYLRISMGELWQKRLMVGGFEKTFEIGRQFRNEGMSREHLQDYSQMECYWAYAGYKDMMQLVESMYKYVVKKTYGTAQFEINGFQVDFDSEWPVIDYVAIIEEKLGINVLSASRESIENKLESLRIKYNPQDSTGRLIDALWKSIRSTIGGPAFLVGHPVEVSPLAKRNPNQPATVERFQVLIAGSENGNGYSELNDPIDQAERFAEQAKLREAGDKEAQMHDTDFVEALEYGMPPTAGFGFSERLFAFLENKTARECQLFPLMRPLGINKQKKINS